MTVVALLLGLNYLFLNHIVEIKMKQNLDQMKREIKKKEEATSPSKKKSSKNINEENTGDLFSKLEKKIDFSKNLILKKISDLDNRLLEIGTNLQTGNSRAYPNHSRRLPSNPMEIVSVLSKIKHNSNQINCQDKFKTYELFKSSDGASIMGSHRETSNAGKDLGTYFVAKNVMIKPNLIEVSKGGEEVDEVLGRREDLENAKINLKSFSLLTLNKTFCNPKFKSILFLKIKFASTKQIINSLCSVDENSLQKKNFETCEETGWENKIVVLVPRIEYVNLFHVINELFSSFNTLELVYQNKEDLYKNIRIIFLDGHAKGFLGLNYFILLFYFIFILFLIIF